MSALCCSLLSAPGIDRQGRWQTIDHQERLAAFGAIARSKGFLQVAASPLTRSSYHAGEDFAQMRAAREAQLAKARG